MDNIPRDCTPEERNLLSGLRNRPGMFFGRDGTLSAIEAFLTGYQTFPLVQQTEQAHLLPEGFGEFVTMRYLGHTRTAKGWVRLIQENEPDDFRACQIFWELLDEYLTSLGYATIPAIPSVSEQPFQHQNRIGYICYADLPVLAESYMRTFNGAPWFDRWSRKEALRRLIALFQTPGFYGLAAWNDGVPMGAVFCRTEPYYGGDCCQIVEFWVEPKFQRMGIGGKLMDEIKHILFFRGVKKLYLITMHSEQTEEFYQKNGFIQQDGLCVMQLSEEDSE